MSLLDLLPSLLRDPAPSYAFEVSEAGIAFAMGSRASGAGFHEIEPGVISVSPSHDNVQSPEVFAAHVGALYRTSNVKKRRTAALVLPDHSARVQVLDFDSFPSNADEQRALIRFRVKKSMPFDVESAAVSIHAQAPAENGKIEVVAAIMAVEILARYEAAFRTAGYAPGLVTTSSLAALNLVPADGLNIMAKLSGSILNVLVAAGPRLKLVRTIELDNVTSDDVLGVLFPTLAYVEDEMSARPDRLLLCGFGSLTYPWATEWHEALNVKVEAVQSRLGSPGPYNAGLLGYLDAMGAAA